MGPFHVKPVHLVEVACGALAVYLLTAGFFIRATPLYNAMFVPLGDSAARWSSVIYAPVIWTVYHAPPVVGATLQGYLEWWGCTFPQPMGMHRRVYPTPR